MSAGRTWVRPQLRAAFPDVARWDAQQVATGTVLRGEDPRGVRWDVVVDEGEAGCLIVATVKHGCVRAEVQGAGSDVSEALTKLRSVAELLGTDANG